MELHKQAHVNDDLTILVRRATLDKLDDLQKSLDVFFVGVTIPHANMASSHRAIRLLLASISSTNTTGGNAPVNLVNDVTTELDQLAGLVTHLPNLQPLVIDVKARLTLDVTDSIDEYRIGDTFNGGGDYETDPDSAWAVGSLKTEGYRYHMDSMTDGMTDVINYYRYPDANGHDVELDDADWEYKTIIDDIGYSTPLDYIIDEKGDSWALVAYAQGTDAQVCYACSPDNRDDQGNYAGVPHGQRCSICEEMPSTTSQENTYSMGEWSEITYRRLSLTEDDLLEQFEEYQKDTQVGGTRYHTDYSIEIFAEGDITVPDWVEEDDTRHVLGLLDNETADAVNEIIDNTDFVKGGYVEGTLPDTVYVVLNDIEPDLLKDLDSTESILRARDRLNHLARLDVEISTKVALPAYEKSKSWSWWSEPRGETGKTLLSPPDRDLWGIRNCDGADSEEDCQIVQVVDDPSKLRALSGIMVSGLSEPTGNIYYVKFESVPFALADEALGAPRYFQGQLVPRAKEIRDVFARLLFYMKTWKGSEPATESEPVTEPEPEIADRSDLIQEAAMMDADQYVQSGGMLSFNLVIDDIVPERTEAEERLYKKIYEQEVIKAEMSQLPQQQRLGPRHIRHTPEEEYEDVVQGPHRTREVPSTPSGPGYGPGKVWATKIIRNAQPDTLEVYAPDVVYHVGNLAGGRIAPSSSLEGAALSVSEHPGEWSAIARLGGAIYSLSRAGSRFLVATPAAEEAARLWAVKTGYLSPASKWRMTYYDSEIDDDLFMEFDSQEEAEEEAEDFGVVEEVSSWDLGEEGERYWRESFTSEPSNNMAGDLAILWYAEDQGYDGVWWHESLNPSALSAPRGALFNINDWEVAELGNGSPRVGHRALHTSVAKIIRNAQPGTLERWAAKNCVAVIEVPGGWCDAHDVTEGSPVDLRQARTAGRIEFLQQRNPDIDVAAIAQADPTPHNEYLTWLVKQHKEGIDVLALTDLLSSYHGYKNRKIIPDEHKDINRLDTVTLQTVVEKASTDYAERFRGPIWWSKREKWDDSLHGRGRSDPTYTQERLSGPSKDDLRYRVFRGPEIGTVRAEVAFRGRMLGSVHLERLGTGSKLQLDCQSSVDALYARTGIDDVWWVFQSDVYDEIDRGHGIGLELYRRAINAVAPAIVIPGVCAGASSSPDALRVWNALARSYETEGSGAGIALAVTSKHTQLLRQARIAAVEEEGVVFDTGRPVTFDFTHKDQPTGYFGDRFGQDIEPHGRYMIHGHLGEDGEETPWLGDPSKVIKTLHGTQTFNNPLVLQHGGYGKEGWKQQVSDRYGGKTGAELTEALIEDGYDGIVTVSQTSRGKEDYISEILDLTTFCRTANKRLKNLEKLIGSVAIADEIKEADPGGKLGYLNWITARVNAEGHDSYPYGEPIEIGTEVREVYNYPSGMWQGKVIGFSEDNDANIVERRDGKSGLMFDPCHKSINVTEAQKLYEKFGKMVLEFHPLREFASKPLAEIENPNEVREHINEAGKKKKHYDANPKKDIAAKGRERLSPKVTFYTNKDAFSIDWGGASDWCTSKWDHRYWEAYASAAKEIYVVKIHPDDHGASQYLKDAKERYPERLQEISHNGLVPFAVAVTVREKKNKDHDPSDPSSEEYTRFRTVSEIVDLRDINPPAEGIRDTIVGELESLNKSIQGVGSGDLYEHLIERGYELDAAAELTADYAAIGVEDADWHSQGFEPPEAKEWIDAGFGEADNADAWKRHGFDDPVEAKSWSEMMDRWCDVEGPARGCYDDYGDSGRAEKAAEWKEGIDDVNAAEFYLRREVEIDTAKKIDGWVGLGPISENQALIEAVLELDEDNQNGFSIGDNHLDQIRPMSELYDGSKPKKERRSADEIRRLVYDADQISDEEVIHFSDALVLARLTEDEYNAWSSSPGIDLSYASSWIDYGFTLDEYKKWEPHFDPLGDRQAYDAYKWKRGTEHMSFESAMKWKDAEFNLPQMKTWTNPDSMFSVQEANEWITAGISKSKGYIAAGYRQAGITPGDLPAMIELGKVTSNRYGAIELKKLLDAGASTLDARELEYLHYALPFDEILERIRSGAIKEHFVPEEKEPIWKCLGCNYENDKEEIPFTCPDCGKWNTFRKFAASRIDEVLIEFPDDPDEVAYLADRDPSGKHAYLRWMMHRVINDTQMEDRVADAVERFHKLKGRLVKKDLWQYKSLDELEDAVEEAGLTRKEEKDLGSRMVQEFSDGAILQILSPGASCQYGANTKWCLSEKDGEQFMSHSEAHDIYFFVPKHGSEVGKWAVLTELGTKEADAAYSALDKKFFFRDMPDNIRKHFEAAGFKGVVETLYRFEDSVGTLYLSSDQIYDALEEYRVDAHGPVFMNIIKIEMLPSTREDLIPRDQIDDTREYFRSIREGEVIETTVYDSWKDTKAIVLRDESNDIIAAFDTLEENKYYLESAIAEGIVDKSLEDWSWEEEEIPDADYNWYNLLGMNEVFPERTGPDSETTIMTPTGPTILKDANKKLRGLESLAGSMPVEAVDKIEEIDPENQRGYLNWIVEQVNVEARPLATPDDVGKEAIAFHRHMSPVQGIITDYDSGDEFIINGRAVRSPRLRDIDPDKARSLFSELVQSVADFHVQREHTPAIQDIKNADDLRDMTQRASHRPDRDKAAEGRHRLSDKVTKYTNKDAMYFDWSGKSDWCVSKWAAPEWDSYQAAGKEIYVVEIPEPYAVAVAGGSLSEVVNLRNKAVEQEDENDMDTWYGVRDTLREALNLPEAFGTIREAVERENDWRAEKNIHSYYDVDDLTARWHENGLHDPEWLTLFDFDEYENAASWAKDKFTPAEADKWMRYPFTVGYSWRAAEWRDAGFTPSEANQMITKSRNKSPPKKAAKETIPLGQCYPFVNELAEEWWDQHIDKDSPPGENVHPDIDDKNKFKVVYGKITDKWSGESALHAWVEKGDLVFDWQTSQTKPNGVQKDVYYDTFQPETDQEYTAEQALIECATGKYRVST